MPVIISVTNYKTLQFSTRIYFSLFQIKLRHNISTAVTSSSCSSSSAPLVLPAEISHPQKLEPTSSLYGQFSRHIANMTLFIHKAVLILFRTDHWMPKFFLYKSTEDQMDDGRSVTGNVIVNSNFTLPTVWYYNLNNIKEISDKLTSRFNELKIFEPRYVQSECFKEPTSGNKIITNYFLATIKDYSILNDDFSIFRDNELDSIWATNSYVQNLDHKSCSDSIKQAVNKSSQLLLEDAENENPRFQAFPLWLY